MPAQGLLPVRGSQLDTDRRLTGVSETQTTFVSSCHCVDLTARPGTLAAVERLNTVGAVILSYVIRDISSTMLKGFCRNSFSSKSIHCDQRG